MKGFKDSSGKFHPITEYKGVRKSRDQKAKTKGVKINAIRKAYDRGTWGYWWNKASIEQKKEWLEVEKHKLYREKEVAGGTLVQDDEMIQRRMAIEPETDALASWAQIEQLELGGWMANHIYDDMARGFLFGKEKNWKKTKPDTGEWEGDILRSKRDATHSVALDDLVKDFPDMMQEIAEQKGCDYTGGKFIKDGFNMETVCGASTSRIYMKLLKIKPIVEGGVYQGSGLMDKEPNRGHQWIRLDDGTIVDGSFGQFLNKKNITAQDRLKIIPPNDPRQDDYVGLYEENPFTREQKYYSEATAKPKIIQRTK